MRWTCGLSHWRGRRQHLRDLLRRSTGKEPTPTAIQLSEPILGAPEAIFRHACQMGLEGIVSKRIDSRYVSGRTSNWLKIRIPTFERR
jgi:bifunctional non-homologous end joining protein LigD